MKSNFQLFCFSVFFLGCQLSHAQTAEETLFAIREIYSNQSGCSLVDTPDLYATGFKFLHSYTKDDAALEFVYSTGIRGKYGSGPDEFSIDFDIRKIASIQPLDKDDDWPKLVFECKNGEGCIFFSGWGQKYSRMFTVFCSKEARARVTNALLHLQKITTPLPSLKF
ncbi:MAG: hypothetical protein Q7J58_21195 [Hydrogenophaga sp.]|jgi:hypothetical protein|uniref:hypothetical protein n=1 Tax=Hydrogenophaga sp. TaxID=1904254 RepID=UPI00272046D4|nr:hypothetical protein [Hydrogenophaga sp.]MDO9571874.1 hypothetical protein [Hydrogenophaga sp.]MDP3373643.1 hypothetical protein [Hydrogenophaga sp.]